MLSPTISSPSFLLKKMKFDYLQLIRTEKIDGNDENQNKHECESDDDPNLGEVGEAVVLVHWVRVVNEEVDGDPDRAQDY